MGKHTPSGSWRHLMGKDSNSNTLQKGNSQQFPMTAPFHFQLKSLFKVYYQKLFMYSKYTPDVFMPWKTCVFMCVCVCKTHWLALKKKNQMSCQSRQLFDAFERSKYVFQLSKSAYDAQKKPSSGAVTTTYVLRDTFPPIFICVVNQNGVLNLAPPVWMMWSSWAAH